MRPNLPWLDQGDIFHDLPVLELGLNPDWTISSALPWGPALLITHGCAIDKRDKGGESTAERLQFVRVRTADALPVDRMTNLRGRAARDDPYEAMWLGEVGNLGDCYVSFTDPYYLPAPFFELAMRDYSTNAEADQADPVHASPRRHDTRMGRLDERQQVLLRRKLVAFYARQLPAM